MAALVLVADADASSRALVTSLLERIGLAAREAETGAAALAAAEAEHPSLVLVEVGLPDMTGYEVCRDLRAAFGEGLPIVLMSRDRTDPADRVAGLMLGADDYLAKPFDPNELLARVRRQVQRARATNPNGPASARAARLTNREREILRLLADGLCQRDIADQLAISPKTVDTHIQRVLEKLDVHSRAKAVALAHRNHLV